MIIPDKAHVYVNSSIHLIKGSVNLKYPLVITKNLIMCGVWI